jgi:hypothetical protein
LSGIARKKENSAAARLSAPSSIAATMLAPDRETPGNHRQALRESDPEIHRQRKCRGIVFVRLEVELIDPQQDGAADDQRKTHLPMD